MFGCVGFVILCEGSIRRSELLGKWEVWWVLGYRLLCMFICCVFLEGRWMNIDNSLVMNWVFCEGSDCLLFFLGVFGEVG